jgi:hypothetical protein
MEDIVAPYHCNSSSASTIQFPSWLQASQKGMFLKDGVYIKGIMEYDLDSKRFSQR